MPTNAPFHPRDRHEPFRPQGVGGVMVFVGATLVIWLLIGRDVESTLRQSQTLSCSSPTLESFFTSHLLHTNGFHLTLTALAVLVAGGLLETRWGTPRFLVFYVFVVVTTTAASLVCGRLAATGLRPPLALEGGEAPGVELVSYGASALALACLTTAIPQVPQKVWLGFFPARWSLWALVVLGAAGLAFLDYLSKLAQEERRLFLLPQISGAVVAFVWLRFAPPCERKFAQWRAARQRREHERLGEIRHRVDELLEKISNEGYESLSADEKSFLRHASKHFKRE